VRTLFVGDVHGCALELSLLIEKAQADRIVLLGDLFTKGPAPKKVWKLIRQHRMEAVMGNQDLRVLQRSSFPLPASALKWLAQRPLFIQGETWIAVHAGLNPFGPTSKQDAVYVRRWPNNDKRNPFWWEHYRGRKLVLYGHDAIRKLQDHRPYTLGLDSGCVYGFALSGYLLEEEKIIQIPALRPYCPI